MFFVTPDFRIDASEEKTKKLVKAYVKSPNASNDLSCEKQK